MPIVGLLSYTSGISILKIRRSGIARRSEIIWMSRLGQVDYKIVDITETFKPLNPENWNNTRTQNKKLLRYLNSQVFFQ